MQDYSLSIDVKAKDNAHAEKIRQCLTELIKNLDTKLLNDVNPSKLGEQIGKLSKNPLVVGIVKSKIK